MTEQRDEGLYYAHKIFSSLLFLKGSNKVNFMCMCVVNIIHCNKGLRRAE